MTATALLLALLALAYVGSLLMGGRGVRGGLPSGAEYVILGVVIGPYALGTVEWHTVDQFQPIVAVGAAWLALIAGIEYGRRDGKRVALGRLLAGILVGLAAGALAGFASYAVARRFTSLTVLDARLLAVGIAIVASGSNKHLARWAAERYGAQGRVTELFEDIAGAADAVPLLALVPVFVLGPSPPTDLPLVPGAAIACALGLGMLLGIVAAILLRVEAEAGDGWGVLLGAALLGTGVAWRLGWSSLTVLFTMGVSIATFSRHREELRTMLASTERPVLLPTLMLTGAQIHLDSPVLPLVALTAVATRAAVRLVIGWLVPRFASPARGAGTQLGLALSSTSGLTLIAGVVFASRFPGAVGAVVLATAAVVAVVGDLVGPGALRRALTHVGEIAPPEGHPPDAAVEEAA